MAKHGSFFVIRGEEETLAAMISAAVPPDTIDLDQLDADAASAN